MQSQCRSGYHVGVIFCNTHVGVTRIISHFGHFGGEQCPKTIVASKSWLNRKVILSLVTPTSTPDHGMCLFYPFSVTL
ncbi:hypothetical protein RSAG8_07551, partial [Rhizoctonia solani AG-8 WAC10335]